MPPCVGLTIQNCPQFWLDASECIVIEGSCGCTGAPIVAVVRVTHHSKSSLLAGFSERIM